MDHSTGTPEEGESVRAGEIAGSVDSDDCRYGAGACAEEPAFPVGMRCYPTHAVAAAREAASEIRLRRGERDVSAESLLLGVLAIGPSAARQLLNAASIVPERLLEPLGFTPEQLAETQPLGTRYIRGGPAVDAALRRAQLEARRRGSTAFGTDHLLVALAFSSTQAGVELRRIGATPELLSAALNQIDRTEQQRPGTIRPTNDRLPGSWPSGVWLAAVVCILQGVCGGLLVPIYWNPVERGKLEAITLVWHLGVAAVLLVSLARGGEWAWSSAVLWLAARACLGLGRVLQSFVVGFPVPDDESFVSYNAVLLFILLQSCLYLGTAVALFLERDWFNPAPRHPWKTLLRQGGLVLAVTVLVELAAAVLPALSQLAPGLRGRFG